MSVSALNSNLRLSDAMERDLMRQELTRGEPASIIDLGKFVLATLKKGAVSFWSYVVDVTIALNDARAKDSRFSGAQW